MSKKSEQLGMNPGTAYHRLRKMILWKYLCLVGDNICFQCGEEIKDIDNVSLEHMRPWLDSNDPVALFFDLDNVAFSHLKCNIAAARKTLSNHGAVSCFDRGCRCDKCREAKRAVWAKYQPHRKSRSGLA